MPLTAKETVAVKNGESAALSRALIAAAQPVSVMRNVAAGDYVVLVKALGLTGPAARAVLNGDVTAIPAAVLGSL